MLLRCQVTFVFLIFWCKLISYLLLADFSIFSLSPMLEISQQWTWCVDFIINYASHSNGSFNLNTYVSQLWEYFVNQYVDNFLFILLCFVFQNPITQGLGILDWLRLTFPLIPYYLFFFFCFLNNSLDLTFQAFYWYFFLLNRLAQLSFLKIFKFKNSDLFSVPWRIRHSVLLPWMSNFSYFSKDVSYKCSQLPSPFALLSSSVFLLLVCFGLGFSYWRLTPSDICLTVLHGDFHLCLCVRCVPLPPICCDLFLLWFSGSFSLWTKHLVSCQGGRKNLRM